MSSLLDIREISVSFGGLKALQDVEIEIYEGEILGLIGPNGAGKSTLFNVITGYVKSDKGEIIFSGDNILGLKPSQICKKRIVRTFQLCRTFERMSVLENVKIGALLRFNKVKEAEARAKELLKVFNIFDKKDYMMEEITLVERKKVEVARAIATEPKIALLDECMTGLILSEINEMLDIIRKIREEYGITICIVEHIMKAIMTICDRVIVLDFGRKIAEGTPEEVSSNKRVIDAYFGEELNSE